jgi:histone-lysine N-methyltransferase SETMAR
MHAISTTSRHKLSSSFFFLQGTAPKEIHAILKETLGEHTQSYATFKNWVDHFKSCDFYNCFVPRPGRLKAVTTWEFTDQIHELILEDHQISAKSRAKQLGITREQVGSIIHEDLDMRKLSTKWVLKCLTADQKHQLLEFFGRDPNDFLLQLVTMDGTWLYHYDPETKQQSMEWWHSCSPRPKKLRVQKSTGKVFVLIFGDQDSTLLTDYLPKGQIINEEYYASLLVQMKDILKDKCRRKVTNGVLFLHDNAPAHQALAIQKKLAYLSFQILDHPSYSLDLAPSDYHLFPGLKKQLEGHHFLSDAEVIAAAETWLDE